MLRILVATLSVAMLTFIGSPRLVDACAGLIGSNGAVNLGRTTTLAAYHEGVEHYVTSFEFLGGGGEFGTLVPLPGVPTNVERGGAWTLQRLVLETSPPPPLATREVALAGAAEDKAEVLIEVRIDALDITVLRGGAESVAQWATEHGFRLSPDAPEMLDFYADRSPIFLAAIFNGDAAAERGQVVGDGTPVHLTIPSDNPWVPLRILGLGKQPEDRIEADVFLLTDEVPTLLPGEREGLALTYNQQATDLLLDDLRSDDGMAWVPESAWLTKLSIDMAAQELTYDLAVDASGRGEPSAVAAGLGSPEAASTSVRDDLEEPVIWAAIALAAALLLFQAGRYLGSRQ